MPLFFTGSLKTASITATLKTALQKTGPENALLPMRDRVVFVVTLRGTVFELFRLLWGEEVVLLFRGYS